MVYRSNEKHTPGAGGKKTGKGAGIEPRNSAEIFSSSVPTSDGRRRFAKDKEGNLHEYKSTNDGSWHWTKSSNDTREPLFKRDVPNEIKQFFEIPAKGNKWK